MVDEFHFCLFFWFSLFILPYDRTMAFIFQKLFKKNISMERGVIPLRCKEKGK